VKPQILATFSTLDPSKNEWYVHDKQVVDAWEAGLSVSSLEDRKTQRLTEEYREWREAYRIESERQLEEIRYKSYYNQAWNALNGFYRCLKAHSGHLMGKDIADRVDFYFQGAPYAESTERTYRRFIGKVLERI
jgi:hypothetical protein